MSNPYTTALKRMMGRGVQVQNLPRQQGKSAALAAAYGSQPHRITRAHPLEYVSGYTFMGHDKRFAGTPVYKVCTKIISEIMRAERVPGTECWMRDMDTFETQAMPGLVGVAWIRRSRKEDLENAVATLLMLDKRVVLLRAFTD